MLTQDNTEGFTQEELNKMNDEVKMLLNEIGSGIIRDSQDYHSYLQWAEEKVLKIHGGA
jgi:hypothetical protein